MSEFIDKEFLTNNLFEQDKIGTGSFPWRYYDKRYDVVIDPWTVGSRPYIYVSNNITKQSIEYIKRNNRLKKEDLHKCIKFMEVPDEFDYE